MTELLRGLPDPNSLWQPVTEEGRALEDHWTRDIGFGFSELGLTNGEADVYLHPFRFPEEGALFYIYTGRPNVLRKLVELGGHLKDPTTPAELKIADVVRQRPSEPLSAEQFDAVPPKMAKRFVEKTGGKKGFQEYIKERVSFFRSFREAVDELSAEVLGKEVKIDPGEVSRN